MGKLYAFAKEVAVWLGLERDNSKAAFQFIQRSTHPELLQRVGSISSQDSQLRTVMALMGRDYWQRAWIIQEVFQARKITIHCGLDVLSWSDLAKFFRRVQHEVVKINTSDLYNGELSAIYDCTAFRLTKDRTSKNRDLHALMLRYKNSLCSDPRDKVFSLCGMSQKHAHLVDYTKSLQELWQSILFSEPESAAKDMYRVRTAQLAQDILQLPAPWSSWETFSVPNMRPRWGDKDVLRCTYEHINIVGQVSPVYRLKDLQSPELFRDWYEKFQGPNMPSLDRIMQAAQGITYNDLQRLRSFERTEKYPVAMELAPSEEIDPDSYAGLIRTPSNSIVAKHDRVRLFTTHNGRLGFAACTVREGDEVIRFSGSDVAVTVVTVVHSGIVIGGALARMFIINSDRSRAGYAPVQDPSYRYAVPDSEDKISKSALRDADQGDGSNIDAIRSSFVETRDFNISQLQFWTW